MSRGDFRLGRWGATYWSYGSVGARLGWLGFENRGVGAIERLRCSLEVAHVSLRPYELVHGVKGRQQEVFDLRCQRATVLIEFVKQVFHTMRELRDRAKTNDACGAFERVHTPPVHFGVAHVGEGPCRCRGGSVQSH